MNRGHRPQVRPVILRFPMHNHTQDAADLRSLGLNVQAEDLLTTNENYEVVKVRDVLNGSEVELPPLGRSDQEINIWSVCLDGLMGMMP